MRLAIIYYRVSTPGQGKSGLGLGAQKKLARLFAKIYKYKVLWEFKDVFSGRTSKRRGLQKALALCKEHGATLIIADMERLARNMAFVSTLMESGVEFVCIDNPHADTFTKHMMAAFAQREWERASKRTKEALAVAKEKGVKLGTDGKKLSRYYKKKRRALHDRVSPIIQGLRKEGYTIREITDYLNKRKIAPSRGKYFKWHLATVHGMMGRV